MKTGWLKTTGKVIGGIVLGVVVLLLLVVLFLQTGAGQSIALDQTLKQVNKTLAGEVRAERLSGGLLDELRLENVRVRDSRGNTVAYIPSVRADYSLPGLVSSQLFVSDVQIDAPVVVSRTYEDGTSNFSLIAQPAPEQTTEPGTFEVFLNRARIENGTVAVIDESADGVDVDQGPLAEWLATLEREPVDIDALSATLGESIPSADKQVPETIGLTGLGLEVGFAMRGSMDYEAEVVALTANLATDSHLGSRKLTLDKLDASYRPEHVELTLGALDVSGLASLADVRAGADLSVEEDALGNRTPTGLDGYAASIGDLTAQPELVELYAPDVGIESAASVRAKASGTLDAHTFDVSLACPAENALRAAGRVAAPDGDWTALEYDVAVLTDGFDGAACAEVASPVRSLTATVRADGKGTSPETLTSNLAVAVEDSQFLDYRVDNAAVRTNVEDGQAVIERLRVETPYANASASGTADIDGNFDLDVDIQGAEELAGRATEVTGRNIRSKAIDLSVDAGGSLDLDADDPLAMVQRLDLKSKWRIDDFAMEDSVDIGSSTGDVLVDVRTPEDAPGKRRVTFDIFVEGRSVDTPVVSASYVLLDAEGNGLIAPPLDDPLAALESLASKWVFKTRNFRAPDTRIGAADIRAQVDRTRPGGPLNWVLDGTVSGVRAAGQTIGFADADLRGTANVTTKDSGTEVSNVSAKGKVSAKNVDAGGTSVEQVDAIVDVRGRPPMLEGSVTANATNIKAGGESIDTAEATLELEGNRQFDLSARVARSGETAPLSLVASGQLDRDLQGVEFDSFEAGSPEMTWRMSKGTRISTSGGDVKVENLELSTGEQRIAVDGAYRATGRQDLDASFDKISIGEIREKLDIPQLPDAKGLVSGSVTLRGTARQPDIDLNIVLEEFYFQGYGPFRAVARAAYDDERLDIARLDLSGYDVTFVEARGSFPIALDLSGEYDILRDDAMSVSVTVPELDLPSIYELVPALETLSAVGSLEARIALDGSLRSPAIKSRINANGLGVEGEMGGQRVELQNVDLAASVDFRPPRNDEGGLDLAFQGDWQGTRIIDAMIDTPMPLARWANEWVDAPSKQVDWIARLEALPFETALQVTNLNLAEVPVESLAQADAEGEVKLDISGSGTFASPNIRLDAGLHDFGWERFRDMFIDIELHQRAGTLFIDKLRFEWDADEIFVAEGKIPTPVAQVLGREAWEDIPIDLKLEVRELPIKKLSAVDYDFAGIQGSFAGYITADGSLRKPNLQGRVGVFNTELARGRKGTIAMEFGANRGSVRARASVCQDTNEVLFANARVPVNLDVISLAQGEPFLLDETIRASVKSEKLRLAEVVPSRLIDDFATDIGGEFKVDMNVYGKLDALRAKGMLQLSDGQVTLPMFGRRFRDIEVDLDVNEERAELAEMSFTEADSSVALSGRVGLDGIQPTNVNLNMKSEEFNVGGFGTTFAAFVTSNIDITGDLSGETRKMKAVARDLEVVLPESQAGDLHPTELNEDIVVLRENTKGGAMVNIDALTSQQTEAEETKPVEFRFVAERGSWLRHPNGNVEFKNDISIRLADGTLQMGGSVDTVRGSIEFLGKRFDIPEKEGVVRFTGAASPNPILDAQAVHVLDQRIAEALQEPTSGDARIIVRVRGRADDPRLLLSSDPGMTESDIIQVLVTGRPPNDSGVGQDQGLQGQALSAATGLLSGLVQQKLAGAVPVDVLRLEAGDEGLGSSRISVGKYITERLFVSYSYKFGTEEEDAENVAKIEYRFAPRWKLETEYSDQQTGEFNIFWEPPLRWLND